MTPEDPMTPGWPALASTVDSHGGVYTTTMFALRTIVGAGRISSRLSEEISSELARRGFGHHPDALPVRAEDPVTVFRLGSLGAEIYGIVKNPEKSGHETLVRAIRLLNTTSEEANHEAVQAFEAMSKPRRKRHRKPRATGAE